MLRACWLAWEKWNWIVFIPCSKCLLLLVLEGRRYLRYVTMKVHVHIGCPCKQFCLNYRGASVHCSHFRLYQKILGKIDDPWWWKRMVLLLISRTKATVT
jgi:hypothetical protein